MFGAKLSVSGGSLGRFQHSATRVMRDCYRGMACSPERPDAQRRDDDPIDMRRLGTMLMALDNGVAILSATINEVGFGHGHER